MKLKGSLEDNILTLLVTSDKYAPSLLLHITPDLFSSRSYRRIAEKATEYIENYNRAAGVHIRDLLEQDLRRGEEGVVLLRILSDLDALAPDIQPEFVMSELNKFVQLRKIAMAAEAAMDAVNQGDVLKAQEAMNKSNVGVDTGRGTWLSEPEGMLKFLETREEDFFPTGIELLDRKGVRPQRKTIFLIVGSKKVGKSWWLIQMGKECIIHRKNVLHITLEMDEVYTAQRYVQAFFAATVREAKSVRFPIFKKDSLGRFADLEFDTLVPEVISNETRAKYAKRLALFKQRARLHIKEFPTGSLTVPQLRAYLDTIAQTENFVPDAVIIDYADLMFTRAENLRIDTGRLFRDLRGLSIERNFALVTAGQGNRQTDTATTVTSGMIAEDWSKAGTVDTICTISKTTAERNLGLARINVDAARHVEDKWMAMITQSYATGQFCLDSVYMSNEVQAEVKRQSGADDDGDSERGD